MARWEFIKAFLNYYVLLTTLKPICWLSSSPILALYDKELCSDTLCQQALKSYILHLSFSINSWKKSIWSSLKKQGKTTYLTLRYSFSNHLSRLGQKLTSGALGLSKPLRRAGFFGTEVTVNSKYHHEHWPILIKFAYLMALKLLYLLMD